MGLGHEKLDVYRLPLGSALACAAIQHVRVIGKALDQTESRNRKEELVRIAVIISRLGGRGYQVREEQAAYSVDFDFDPDSDFDLEDRNSQQADPVDARTSRQ